MRPARAALIVAATALTPALLLATPAFATAAAAAPASAPVTQATAGDDKPVDEMSEDDLRVAVLRILGGKNVGVGVTREANAALNGTPDDLRAFLKTGYRLAQAEDDRVAIGRILAKPNISKALRKAAEKALADGTPEALRHFLEVGQYEAGGK
ncbi:hypothetical protein ADK70_04580 [Streptomyces rimosus subsp. pseudoverticillatus]|uniref:ALF repeat-containing protein n=1 Tax=Streptomyces rimosus TaxID=1927 RepID=UPI0006B27204|nr:ALF repeat-containing protein [Streptomyces rimosus]KOT99241.1 hypothetical protein ADK70_04580 [Streptomyces rimosus subsp. pseudoverticillatus]